MKTVVRAFSLKAHAKLNLRLEVGPIVGPLHQVVSVVAALDLADELHFSPSPPGLQIVCQGLDLDERDNLVWRAVRALDREPPDVRITIEKRIPTQAGLGGGSADAAAALLGVGTIFAYNGVAVARERIEHAALRTGSDVPALLVPGLRIVSGVGDVVARRSCSAPPWGVVLVRPDAVSPTNRAYELLDAAAIPHSLGSTALDSAEAMCAAFARADLEGVLSLLHNDFTDVIERELRSVAFARARLRAAGAAGTIVCGSGSCIAGLFESQDRAHAALGRMTLAKGEWACVTGFCGD